MVTHSSQMASQAERRIYLSDGKLLKKEKKGLHFMANERTCPDCKRQLSEDAEYCPYCGNKL